NTARTEHTATLLPNGKVLVAGGATSGGVFASAELYDPASGTWTATGSLNTGRLDHTATLLPNGMVLVAGGYDGSHVFVSAELYTPAATPTPTPTPTITPTPTATPTATPNPRPITVTFKTNPAGLSYTVDGTTYNSAHVFSWRSGSRRAISTTSPQSGGSGV